MLFTFDTLGDFLLFTRVHAPKDASYKREIFLHWNVDRKWNGNAWEEVRQHPVLVSYIEIHDKVFGEARFPVVAPARDYLARWGFDWKTHEYFYTASSKKEAVERLVDLGLKTSDLGAFGTVKTKKVKEVIDMASVVEDEEGGVVTRTKNTTASFKFKSVHGPVGLVCKQEGNRLLYTLTMSDGGRQAAFEKAALAALNEFQLYHGTIS